ncbi:Transmembrane protein 41B [Mortierella claussenii]|nr:Transmembrane protein 41B [Mortierella claussenii]
MSSSETATDATPLLGNVTGNNNGGGNSSDNTKEPAKQGGIRGRLASLSSLQSFLALILLAAVVFSSVYLMIKYTLPKDLPDEQRKWLKFPRNAEDVQHLSIVLESYLAQHYYQVLICFISTYVALQAFAIPGTMMLSVLGGALFKFWVGLITVLLSCSFGALCCYTISWYLMHPIVEKYLKMRLVKLQAKIDAKRDQLFFYFAFLRVSPFVPNWFMNIASCHLEIPANIFFFGTLVGVLPNSLVTVQAGATLAALASPDDFTLLTPQNIIMTVVIALCLLLPIVLNRHAEDPLSTPKVDSAEQNDPLARV